MTRVFLYGTLQDDDLRRIVLGCRVATRPATLANHAVRSARDGDWPAIVPEAGAETPGLLTEPLDAEALARFDWYERAFDYVAETVEVEGGTARLYRGAEAPSTEAWSLGAWQARWAVLSRIAAVEVMGHHPSREPGWISARWPQIRQRAASGAAARATTTPMGIRSGLTGAQVGIATQRRPYTDYFSLIEQDLRFRRFGGGDSAIVSRAALVSGDAATVLPYDPRLDVVLVVEQFRFGPWARGDARPWTIEPIAGRIDAGESPEETVRREAREEAGLAVGRLEHVASYYPTTGAMSEYVHSFVGLCDLEGHAGTVSGAVEEDEDILSHVVPFARLMEAVASGEAENAPLLISAMWLAANRERLRLAVDGAGR